MKWFIQAAGLMMVLTPYPAMAQHDNHEHPAAAKPAEKAAPVLKQTTCPVSGKPVNKEVTADYQGRKVLFCCKDCVPKFQGNPEAYLPALYDQWYPQSVQTACPVMGEEIDGKTFTEFKGQRIEFCCPSCVGKFKAAPAKYLTKLEKLSTTQVHCPVTGAAINPKFTTKYEGQPVYFSSQEALARFEADPKKYAEKLLPEQGVLARGATADDDLMLCAVCAEGGEGGTHPRKQLRTVVLNGKAYFTCSAGCEKKLKADLAKYEPIIRKAAEKAAARNEWYTCPMHADVLQKGPGKCPKCSMELKALNRPETDSSTKAPGA